MNDFEKRLRSLGEGECFVLGSGERAHLNVSVDGVAPEHARITRSGGGLVIRDLDSWDGTFVNGAEVRGLVPLRPGDRLRLGNTNLDVPARYVLSAPGALAVTVDEASKSVPDKEGPKTILKGVNIHIPGDQQGQFVGILGASGSGKSTLIKAMAGLTKLTSGEVRLDGVPASADELCRDRRIAYLPQEVLIHSTLTPAKALGYIARLKQAAGGGSEMVAAALERVGLVEKQHVPIWKLSGGQQKRVALAAELLGDPRLILLDEATSGLDPATEGEMMELFRLLADEGRTVVCITHFAGRLDLCHRLLYLVDGRCVFQGKPKGLTEFFDVGEIEDAYFKVAEEQKKREEVDQPREQYSQELQNRFRSKYPGSESVPSRAAGDPPSSAPAVQLGAWQALLLLTQRYLRLQYADRRNLGLVFLQAPVIGLMVGWTFGSIKTSFLEQHASSIKQVLFVLVLALLWCSGAAGVREIVKEMPILRHERRFGLALGPYLLSKLLLLEGMALVQTLVLLATVRWFTNLEGTLEHQFLVLAVTSFVGVAMGLCVSALAKTSEQAMTILPVLLIGQAIFSGGLARLAGYSVWVGWLLAPAYWSLDGLRSELLENLQFANYPGASGSSQPPILGGGGPLALDLVMLGLQAVMILVAASCILWWQTDRAGRR